MLRANRSGYVSLQHVANGRHYVSGVAVSNQLLEKLGFEPEVVEMAAAAAQQWRGLKSTLTGLAAKAPTNASQLAMHIVDIATQAGKDVVAGDEFNDATTAIITQNGELVVAIEYVLPTAAGSGGLLRVFLQDSWWLVAATLSLSRVESNMWKLKGHWRFSASPEVHTEAGPLELASAVRAVVAEHRFDPAYELPWTAERLRSVGAYSFDEDWIKHVPASDLSLAIF